MRERENERGKQKEEAQKQIKSNKIMQTLFKCIYIHVHNYIYILYIYMIYNREYNIQAKQKKNPKKTATIFFLRFFVNTQKHESHKKKQTKQNKTK